MTSPGHKISSVHTQTTQAPKNPRLVPLRERARVGARRFCDASERCRPEVKRQTEALTEAAAALQKASVWVSFWKAMAMMLVSACRCGVHAKYGQQRLTNIQFVSCSGSI